MFSALFFSPVLVLTNAHLTAWHPAMYCLDGVDGHVDLNAAAPVTPLYHLKKEDWWFHHINKCDEFPPAPGVFLDLPAGGQFQIEIASNRAKTSLSYSGRDTSDWPDGGQYPENYNVPTCITSPNMHTQNETMAAGTAFAISYHSDIRQTTPDNLVVFSVRYHTPWKRVTTYDVPAAMPACPPDGCICAWGWIPNGCGQPNMYHQAFRCKVTNAHSTVPVAAPKPPVWCEGKPEECTQGAKQMIYWNQQDGNNIVVDGLDLSGHPKSPGYNMKTGFADGAQNDIFEDFSAGNGASNNPPNHSMTKHVSPHAVPTPTASLAPVTRGHAHSHPRSGTFTSPVSSAPPVPNIPSTPEEPTTPHESRNCPSNSKRSKVHFHDVHKRNIHKSRLQPASW